jgi:hypothetical protein
MISAILSTALAAPTDIRVTKHQWGAFYNGTDLDVQLRRRGNAVPPVVLQSPFGDR